MKDVILFSFNGELMCFVHVMLNALDMKRAGMNPRIVFEGATTKLVPEWELTCARAMRSSHFDGI